MKTQAAVLHESPGKWSVEDVTLDDPGHGEILVRMVATGLCHSDDHIAAPMIERKRNRITAEKDSGSALWYEIAAQSNADVAGHVPRRKDTN